MHGLSRLLDTPGMLPHGFCLLWRLGLLAHLTPEAGVRLRITGPSTEAPPETGQYLALQELAARFSPLIAGNVETFRRIP